MFNKLTTADTNGKIVVWINHDGINNIFLLWNFFSQLIFKITIKGAWYEEMVNKRDNTIITGMKWSSDGQHICIIYNDGVIILGSLEGNRVWVKELKNTNLTNVEVNKSWLALTKYVWFIYIIFFLCDSGHLIKDFFYLACQPEKFIYTTLIATI